MNINPMLLSDFYKISHKNMYPTGTQYVYSTWTPRDSKIEGINEVVVFGLNYFIKHYLIEYFNENFFNKPIDIIKEEYCQLISTTLGIKNPNTTHIEALHKLGYLPLIIKAIPEGFIVPIRTPIMTVENSLPEFFWLTNYIETLASCILWQPCTSATLANRYKKLFDLYALETVGNTYHTKYQGHDFSMRGMSSLESAILSGMGHLTSFVGTDTIPAIVSINNCYPSKNQLIGTSIPATEHSIECAYNNNDLEYIKHIITEVHPTGLVSIVCDGYDYWNVITNILPSLKDIILKRDGKVVIRPDSGNPIDIVCGDGVYRSNSFYDKAIENGSIWALNHIFGGTTNTKGYKELNPHIGLIYGDAITYDRASSILKKLKESGFASSNIVFGIGSYTYQYNTRDTFGFALKTTLCVINGEEKHICKNPKTDNGIKKSLTGKVAVIKENNTFKTLDGLLRKENIQNDFLSIIYCDGKLIEDPSFDIIRERIEN